MAWSTKQLAELAGTTVKAIRHYHEIGLLEEPHRTSNGYKQYEVRRLVSLLQITRLTDLDMPLAQIGAMRRTDVDPDTALRELDEELQVTIARLSRVRAELSLLLSQQSSADMPAGVAPFPRICPRRIGLPCWSTHGCSASLSCEIFARTWST